MCIYIHVYACVYLFCHTSAQVMEITSVLNNQCMLFSVPLSPMQAAIPHFPQNQLCIVLFYLHNTKLLARAALIHLKREGRSTEEQDNLDQEMEAAISQAHASAGVMVSVGRQPMHNCRYELIVGMEKLHEYLP